MWQLLLTIGVFTAEAAVDCTGVPPYDASLAYSEGQRCYKDAVLYEAPYYQQGQDPAASDSVWKRIDDCQDGTLGSGDDSLPSIDCSEYFRWQEGTAYDGERKWYVYRDSTGHGYINKFYADTDPATDAAAWETLGKCEQGTMNPEGPSVDPVDCTGVMAWSGSQVYASSGLSVYSENKMYISKFWTSGDRPGQSDTWTFVAPCKSGTDTLPAGSNGMELTDEKKQLLCTCCQKCAKLEVTGPVCLDDVAKEEDCYFAWCPKHDNFNSEQCADITKRRLLETYTGAVGQGMKEWPKKVYVPYIDGGLAVQPKLSEMATTLGIKHFIIAFVVAGSGGEESPIMPCRGGFASVIPPYVGPTTYNATTGTNDYVWDEVGKLRALGGDITVSFGGANGVEIADSKDCQASANPAQAIADAYSEVIDFLNLTHIDFDIEGGAYDKTNRETGWVLRFDAVRLLEAKYPELKVWWTLPILPQGLTESGVLFIHDMMASGVRWDRFNVMTMDYGSDIVCLNDDMHQCEIDAITNLAEQFYTEASKLGLTTQYGWNSAEDVYPYLGTTPMIGQNDIVTENYSIQNAKDSFEIWKTKKPLGILSNWSLTRDHPCPEDYTSCTCSSVNSQSESYEYAKIWAPYTSSD